jgi:hypothetical protein
MLHQKDSSNYPRQANSSSSSDDSRFCVNFLRIRLSLSLSLNDEVWPVLAPHQDKRQSSEETMLQPHLDRTKILNLFFPRKIHFFLISLSNAEKSQLAESIYKGKERERERRKKGTKMF